MACIWPMEWERNGIHLVKPNSKRQIYFTMKHEAEKQPNTNKCH